MYIRKIGGRFGFCLSIRRMMAGQTRYGIRQNVNDAGDRRSLGGWYFHVHAWPVFVELYGPIFS